MTLEQIRIFIADMRIGSEAGMKEIIIEVPDRFGKTLKPEKVNSEIKGELVRCRDCTFRNEINCPLYYRHSELPPDDWFCADGERKEGL